MIWVVPFFFEFSFTFFKELLDCMKSYNYQKIDFNYICTERYHIQLFQLLTCIELFKVLFEQPWIHIALFFEIICKLFPITKENHNILLQIIEFCCWLFRLEAGGVCLALAHSFNKGLREAEAAPGEQSSDLDV